MKFEKFQDDRGEWRWRLRARNGKILASSGEGFKREAKCDHSIALVKASGTAPVRTVAA